METTVALPSIVVATTAMAPRSTEAEVLQETTLRLIEAEVLQEITLQLIEVETLLPEVE